MKHSTTGIHLLRHFANEGQKIFSTKQAQNVARQLGINPSYVSEALHHLLKEGWIIRLKRGVYAFSSESGFGSAPHEFAIAMALVNPCTISHWTAMHYHHITQQTPNKVFAITPSGTSIPRSLGDKPYQFIQVKKENYFGIETIWVDEIQVQITSLERTLLDGLVSPQYCGGFQEVLHAFKTGKDRIHIDRIMEYALGFEIAVAKRLGLILEKFGISENKLSPLLDLPIKGYRKFDPSCPNEGTYNSKWKIQENI